MRKLLHHMDRLDSTVTERMAKIAIPLLRVSLGITYIWFGALKIVDRSPVADLVAAMAPRLPQKWFVRTVGVGETVIGVALLFRMALRPTLLMLFGQLLGTFLTLIVRPQDTFQNRNPLLLTKEGEFVIKNLILLSAGVAVGSTARRKHEDLPGSDGS